MRRVLIASASLALLLSGCGEFKDTISPAPGSANHLTLELDSAANGDDIGIYEAQALGFFRQTDIDVRIVTPSSPTAPLSDLAAGKVQVAVASEPDVLLGRNDRENIAAIGAITQSPLAAVLSPAAKPITKLSALRGRSLGYPGTPGQAAVIGGLLAHAGVSTSSVRIRAIGADVVRALNMRTVGAVLGSSNRDPLELAHTKKHAPGVIDVTPADGVPTYEGLVFAARQPTIINRAPLLRRFVQAVARGYRAARANPVAATQALVRADPELNEKLELAVVRATMSSFFPTGDHPWGWQRAAQWNAFGTWLTDRHLLSDPNAITDASTNELLAGQGV